MLEGSGKLLKNRIKGAGGAMEAVNNRSNSIGVDMGIVILFLSIMKSQMKLLTHSAICDFVSK